MMYVYKIISLVFSLSYLLSKYDQGQGLIQFNNPLATFMFGVFQHMF